MYPTVTLTVMLNLILRADTEVTQIKGPEREEKADNKKRADTEATQINPPQRSPTIKMTDTEAIQIRRAQRE